MFHSNALILMMLYTKFIRMEKAETEAYLPWNTENKETAWVLEWLSWINNQHPTQCIQKQLICSKNN